MNLKVIKKRNENLLRNEFGNLKIGECFVLDANMEKPPVYQKIKSTGMQDNAVELGSIPSYFRIKADALVYPVDISIFWSLKYKTTKNNEEEAQ